MGSIKRRVIDLVESMPDNATIDDIIRELNFTKTAEEGLCQLNDNQFITHEQVKQRMFAWLEK